MTRNIILIFHLFNFLISKAQETNTKNILCKDLYIYIDNSSFTGSKGDYIISFSVSSLDKRFSHDNYSFRIYDPIGEDRNLFKLGTFINTDTISYIIPAEYYKNKQAWETHNELSLTIKNDNLRVFIVTELPRELLFKKHIKGRKYMVWEASYNGTVKDLSYINSGKNVFLKEL